MTKSKAQAVKVLNEIAGKIAQSESIYKELHRERDPIKMKKFVALNLLDFFLTQVSPQDLAEYQQLRYKK